MASLSVSHASGVKYAEKRGVGAVEDAFVCKVVDCKKGRRVLYRSAHTGTRHQSCSDSQNAQQCVAREFGHGACDVFFAFLAFETHKLCK
jgi:hypothetical protein